MLAEYIAFYPPVMFAGFGLCFFFGNLVSLIKYIITAVIRWIRS